MLAADECEVITLAVPHGARRAGVGRALMEALLRSARAGGAAAVHLEVGTGNTAARALYESMGFAPVGRRPGYYAGPDGRREDAIRMARSLAAV
jgi:ribosomal-protein-alanine N-acetyltransferase